MNTLTQIQDELIEVAQVVHSKDGRANRTLRAAIRRTRAAFLAWGFTDTQAQDLIRQALDVADLQINADEE